MKTSQKKNLRDWVDRFIDACIDGYHWILDTISAGWFRESPRIERYGKIIRHFVITATRNFFFRLFVTAAIFLTALSFAAYYFERNYTEVKTENGIAVEEKSNIRELKDAVWWAFVTSTTVGYGDYYPKSFAGRLVGIILMFFGVTLVGVITGNIASSLVEKQLKEGRGLRELKLINHFIICGWKRDMAKVLFEIMEKNKNFLPSEFVLINTAPEEEIENLRSDPRFARVNYIHGDYIDERVLNRANLKKAARVLLLADRLVQGSVQEVDSRTVMAVITIKAMSKTVYTCAELLEDKFERYLRFSNCDEIILSSEHNRSILANASAGSGVSQVIAELLNVNSAAGIATREIPDRFIGRNFVELFEYFIGKNRTICIGVLENTGNFILRKQQAIREAQKTPDISALVDRLKEVKRLAANLPVINPPRDYIIKKYSRAIVIEGRADSAQKREAQVKDHGIS